MTTIGEALEESVQALLEAGIDEARLDARLLLAHALDCTPEHVFGYPEEKLGDNDPETIRRLVARRINREPLALITGRKEFWSLSFRVSEATLIPRPDSETLIEAVLAAYPDKGAPLRILDLGTGSGCLLLALLSEYPSANGVGIDFSSQALQVARVNAKDLDLSLRAGFVAADWNDDTASFGVFDIVISNPPYIPDGERDSLQPEVVEYEPNDALFAGIDGLRDYRSLVSLLPGLLKKRGAVFFEVGEGQDIAVHEMLKRAGFSNIAVRNDIAGIGRYVSGTR